MNLQSTLIVLLKYHGAGYPGGVAHRAKSYAASLALAR